MTPRTILRPLASVLSAGVVAAALAANPAGAATGVAAARIAGPDRYATAAAIAAATFPSGPANTTAVLASGTNFPDALAANYLAGRLQAPMLLTDANTLSAAASSALTSLNINTVDVVGGPLAVSDSVIATLQSNGYRVARVSGTDRYATSSAVALAFPSTSVGSFGSGGSTAIVATGTNFADAMSAGPVAFNSAFPLLLTTPDTLAPAVKDALSTLGISQVLLIGGTLAVSPAVATQITALGITVTRIGGADRTETATRLADAELATLGWSADHVDLARGDDYPDALTGGPLAGTNKTPLLLTGSPTILGAYTTAWLQGHHTSVGSITVFGGTLAVSDATVNAAVQAAG